MNKYRPVAAALILVLSLALLIWPGCSAGPGRPDGRDSEPAPVLRPSGKQKEQAAADKTYKVVKVIDGDTIKVDYRGKTESVRFIGVNTPEVHHPSKGVEDYGREAAAYTAKLLSGKRVKLVFDVAERDRYGRLLAYVYTEDGRFVNALLMKDGYAQVMTVPPNVRYQALFIELQKEARNDKRGLWAGMKYRMENPPN